MRIRVRISEARTVLEKKTAYESLLTATKNAVEMIRAGTAKKSKISFDILKDELKIYLAEIENTRKGQPLIRFTDARDSLNFRKTIAKLDTEIESLANAIIVNLPTKKKGDLLPDTDLTVIVLRELKSACEAVLKLRETIKAELEARLKADEMKKANPPEGKSAKSKVARASDAAGIDLGAINLEDTTQENKAKTSTVEKKHKY